MRTVDSFARVGEVKSVNAAQAAMFVGGKRWTFRAAGRHAHRDDELRQWQAVHASGPNQTASTSSRLCILYISEEPRQVEHGPVCRAFLIVSNSWTHHHDVALIDVIQVTAGELAVLGDLLHVHRLRRQATAIQRGG